MTDRPSLDQASFPGVDRPDLELMRKIERAVARNLRDYVTVYRSVFPREGTECIAVAGGVAAFTGIGSPLTTVKGPGAHLSPDDLVEVESFFRAHGVETVTLEMAPWLDDESRQLLGERGYRAAGQEDVVATTSGTLTSGKASRTDTIPERAWPELMRRTSELPDESPTKELAIVTAHLPNAVLYGVREDDRWIACAQSVTYDDVAIFGCDGTLPEARRGGAQTTLIEGRLGAVPAGQIVMAEVAPGSGSERNYVRCGFQIAYARTHFARAVG